MQQIQRYDIAHANASKTYSSKGDLMQKWLQSIPPSPVPRDSAN